APDLLQSQELSGRRLRPRILRQQFGHKPEDVFKLPVVILGAAGRLNGGPIGGAQARARGGTDTGDERLDAFGTTESRTAMGIKGREVRGDDWKSGCLHLEGFQWKGVIDKDRNAPVGDDPEIGGSENGWKALDADAAEMAHVAHPSEPVPLARFRIRQAG